MKLSVITPVRNGEAFILRALKSIPKRNDIEIIVVDDCSEDGTYEMVDLYKKYSEQNIILLRNETRLRACGSINRGLDVAQGTFVVQLDADDYLDTRNFNGLLDLNRHEDLQFFKNQVNNGDIWNPEGSRSMCDHSCLYRRSLIGDTRHEFGKQGTGRKFHDTILAKPHTEYYYKRVAYYYNFPREGSNLNLAKRGLLD